MSKKILFQVMQAIEVACLAEKYKEGGLIEIDSREKKEMNFLPKYEFERGARKLKKFEAITIEDWPSKGEHPYNRHYRFKKIRKYNNLYKKLGEKYPDLVSRSNGSPYKGWLKCGDLRFKPATGEFSYGEVKGKISLYAAPWSALYYFLLNKNAPITREKLEAEIKNGWRQTPGKKAGKSGIGVDIPKIIQQIRQHLKMGDVNDAVNKNLIEGMGDGKSYRLVCK